MFTDLIFCFCQQHQSGTMLPRTATEALKSKIETSKAVTLIKSWHELILDYLSILGMAIAVLGVSTISLRSTSETVQCIPGDIPRYSNDLAPLKDYINGKCARNQQVIRIVGYPYFLLLFWFTIGLFQLWHRVPKVNGKIETFYKNVLKICGETRPSAAETEKCVLKSEADQLFDNFHAFTQVFGDAFVYKTYLAKLVLQAILSVLVYWVINKLVFSSWIHNASSGFSCKIACGNLDVLICELLPQTNAQGISIANSILTAIFAMLNIYLLVKTFFRIGFNSSDFPLDMITLKQRFCFDSFAELSFLLKLLKQHSNFYFSVFQTIKLFIPHEVKLGGEEDASDREIVALIFLKVWKGVTSGNIRCLNYKSTPRYLETVAHRHLTTREDIYFDHYCNIYEKYRLQNYKQEFQSLLRKLGLDTEGKDPDTLLKCLGKEHQGVKPKDIILLTGNPKRESEELLEVATKFNILIVLAQPPIRPSFKGGTNLELQFVVPPNTKVIETQSCLLTRVSNGMYKVLQAVGEAKTSDAQTRISLETSEHGQSQAGTSY